MSYRAVVFDLFGTLVDVFTLSAYNRVLADMAATLDVDEAAFREAWHAAGPRRGDGTFQSGQENVRWCLDRMGVSRADAAVDAATGYRLDLCRRWIVPHEDVKPTLAELRRLGYKVALLSNCAAEISAIWPESPLAGCFDTVVLSCDVRLRKPDPAIFALACERLGVAPAETLYVGDGDDHELEGAAAAGLNPVLIRHPGEDSADVFRRHDADAWEGPRIERISQVVALVDS